MLEKNETERTDFTDESKAEKIAELKKMLKELEHLKNTHVSDDYLDRYLYGTEFDVEAAFTKMKMFYDELLHHPEWYKIVAPLDQKSLIEKNIRIMLPEFDREGRVIYIAKLGNINVRTMELLDVVAVDDIWIESILSSNPHITEKGLCAIIDIANCPWNMVKWFTPEFVKLSVKKLQCLPFKDFRFHIVNNSVLLHVILKIVWPFLPEHIKQMVKFHFDDRNSFFEHIDPTVLPLEYGGSNTMTYNEIYAKLYERNEEIVTRFKSHRTINT